MDFLNYWLQGIIVAVIVSTIIELISPSGNTKKYIKVVLGIYVVFNIITPIINQFSNSNFELSSILNIEEYTKKMETYEVDSKNININSTNNKNIKEIYISNMKNDIKTKLKEKGYTVKKANLKVENDENYSLKSISLTLEKKEEKEENNEEVQNNKIVINEIETVNIKIQGNTENEDEEEKSKITDNEKKEVKEYLSSVYGIKEEQIKIL